MSFRSCDAVAYVANPPTTNSSALDKLCKVNKRKEKRNEKPKRLFTRTPVSR